LKQREYLAVVLVFQNFKLNKHGMYTHTRLDICYTRVRKKDGAPVKQNGL
jgi:hypothetical protein